MFWNPYQPLSNKTRRSYGLIAVLTIISLWCILSFTGLVSASKLPSPLQVLSALKYLTWHNGESLLLPATLWSLGRIAIAAIFAIGVGVPIGVMMGASPKLNAMLSPLVDPFRSAPVVAILPILVMWLGIGEVMKVAFLFLGAVVYLIPLVRDAVQAVPQSYFISAFDLGAKPWEAIQKAVLPMALPRIADSVIVSVSVMWTYITVAEYVNAQVGLGQLIQNAKRFSAMDQVFAGIIVIIALALITYRLMQWIKSRLFPWETKL